MPSALSPEPWLSEFIADARMAIRRARCERELEHLVWQSRLTIVDCVAYLDKRALDPVEFEKRSLLPPARQEDGYARSLPDLEDVAWGLRG